MKTMLLSFTLGVLALSAFGCNQSAEEPHKTTTEQFTKVGNDAQAVSQDMKDYTFSEKADFVAKMQTQIDDINRELDQISMKIEKSNEAAQTEGRPKLKALRDQVMVLSQQLEKAKGADASGWEDIKSGVKKGYQELKEGFTSARQWTSDKIAP